MSKVSAFVLDGNILWLEFKMHSKCVCAIFKLLDKATNPVTQDEDWSAIVAFCDRVNKDPSGPQTAVQLLVLKIQSLQEKESLLALTVIKQLHFLFIFL